MLTLVLYGMPHAAGAMPMAPPTHLDGGASFQQAATAPVMAPTVAPVAAGPADTRGLAEPGMAATLALGLSLLGLARRRWPLERG